ncbi:hypothetical protein [Metabacillus fastidiosus]
MNLGLGYSKNELEKRFQRSRTIHSPTNITMDIYNLFGSIERKLYGKL